MPLRLLSYNILAGGEDRLPLIAAVIQRQHPDVVALLEARSRSNAEAPAQQLGMHVTEGEANNPNKDHVIWLSRLPVIRAENHCLPVFAKTVIEIEVVWGSTPVTLLAAHLKAGQDQERERYRVAEMQVILSLLRGCHNPYHALVGDLNTIHPADRPNVSPYLAELRQRGEKVPTPQFPRQVIPFLLASGYVDCYRALHPSTSGYTAYHGLRIDYILASLMQDASLAFLA